jgi:hypothetical protein
MVGTVIAVGIVGATSLGAFVGPFLLAWLIYNTWGDW